MEEQPVAIKVIQLKSLKDQNTRRFLTNELQCLRRLDHPNVLRYVNSFMTANNCYIITELYNDGDLSKMLRDKGKFTQEQAFEFFLQFYQGYKHFNSRGFIHRDIKPSNILIQSRNDSGDDKLFVIADFGFIKYIEENPKDSFNVGTPVYMAPESIASNIYTVKSDVWSMGVMLYELVYGCLPFQERTEVQLKREICNKEVKLNDVQEKKGVFMSSEFKSLVLSCLRKNPENRITLEDIGEHVWFRKFAAVNSIVYDLDIRMGKSQWEQCGRPVSLLSLKDNKNNSSINNISEPNNYGYIGNVAIKRQKSLKANNFSLKNYQKSPSLMKQNINISIQRHRQKASKILDTVNCINGQKQNKLKIKQPDTYFAHNLMKFSNLPVTDSPKINMLLQKKNGLQGKSSMLQGMKGIVNIKNSQVLKINNCNQMGDNMKRRQSYQKLSGNKLEMSISLQENGKNSQDSSNGKTFSNLSSMPIVNSFQSLPLSQGGSTMFISHTTTEQSLANIENCSLLANCVKRSLQQPKSSPSLSVGLPFTDKKSLSPQIFYLKGMHLLRYVFEVLSTVGEYDGEARERLVEGKECLEEFFVGYFVKLKRSLLKKENLFGLDDWTKFIQSQRHQTFVQVIQKYDVKYSSSPVIGQRLRKFITSAANSIFILQTIPQYQAASYNLLKLAEQLGSTNKQTQKKSLRTFEFNLIIVLIYNMQKCMQMISKVIDTDKTLMLEIDPEKLLKEMNVKSKDPFKIPKMLIQLKKKLILIEGRCFAARN